MLLDARPMLRDRFEDVTEEQLGDKWIFAENFAFRLGQQYAQAKLDQDWVQELGVLRAMRAFGDQFDVHPMVLLRTTFVHGARYTMGLYKENYARGRTT